MSSDITFAELEQGIEQTTQRIENLTATGMLLSLEKLASHFERCLELPLETDDTPLRLQHTISLLYRVLFSLDERLAQMSALTAEEICDLNILAERIASLFQQINVRVLRFVEAFAKFETLQSGSIN